MRLGALLGPVSEPGNARFLAEQARAYSDQGYDSLWMAQAVGRGFLLTDPFVALSVAATVADGVELGTAVLQLPLYHPADLAHRIFSLRQIAGDRLIIGLGAGSTRQDFDAYGRPYEERFRAFDTSLQTLREYLTTGASGSSSLSPWRSLLDSTPLFFGSWGKGVARAAREFDGWIASGHYRTVDEVCAALARYREFGGGRAVVSTIQIPAGADLGELGEKLARYAQAGFDDAVVMILPGGPAPEAVRKLVS